MKALLFIVLFPYVAFAGTIPTVCHNELTAWITSAKPLAIVDTQTAAQFKEHHYENSVPTGNRPQRLKQVAHRVRKAPGKVVVVSSTGGADAERSAERLIAGGVSRERILVLEGGMEAAANNALCDCCKPKASQEALK